jgi:hypothetical protein
MRTSAGVYRPWLYLDRSARLLAASTLAVVLVHVSGMASILKPLLVLGFLLVCPGMAYVRLLELHDPYAQWGLAIAVSLAVEVAVVEAMLFAHMWSATRGLLSIALLSLLGVALQVLRAWRADGVTRQASIGDAGEDRDSG